MPKKETGVPNLDKYLGERQRTLCNYEQGARMYGVPYYTFVNLCKEAGASFKVKRTAIVDLDGFFRNPPAYGSRSLRNVAGVAG